MKTLFFCWVDRQNDKTIINSHISGGMNLGYDIRPNNFDILP